MRFRRFVTPIFGLMCALAPASQAQQPSDTTAIAGFSYASFGARLLRTAIEQSSLDSNRILSPVGAGQALAMVFLGARKSTARAIAQTLDIGSMTAESLAARNGRLNEHWRSRKDLTLKVANALWVDPSTTLRPVFERTVRETFGATIRMLSLTSPQIVAELNRWADSTTAGKIKKVRDTPFEDQTELVLTNAIYLKSTWLMPFDSGATQPRPFTPPSGPALMVPTMTQFTEVAYRRGKNLQTVRLPYKEDLTALYIVLPDSGQSPLTVLDDIRMHGWPLPLSSEIEEVVVRLPKVHVEQETPLVRPLTALGMGIAFDPRRADFSGLTTSKTFISEAEQHVYFDVDETGTEAAAVTVIGVRTTSARRKPPVNFVVDRPFLFALRDERTGALLFVGYVARPNKT